MPLSSAQQAAVIAAADAAFQRKLDSKIRDEIVEVIRLARPSGGPQPIVHNRLILGWLRGDKTAVFVSPDSGDIVNGWFVTRLRINPDTGRSRGVERTWTYLIQFAYEYQTGTAADSSERTFGLEVDQAVAAFDAIKTFAGCLRHAIQGATTLEQPGGAGKLTHLFTATMDIEPNYC